MERFFHACEVTFSQSFAGEPIIADADNFASPAGLQSHFPYTTHIRLHMSSLSVKSVREANSDGTQTHFSRETTASQKET